MSSEIIQEQDFVRRVLIRHVETGRLAHTYLFTGKKGSGKKEMAGSFAAALNCEKNRFFDDCDCASCRKVGNQSHPDVKWLGLDPKVRSIKIEEIRDLLNWAALKPYEGKWKVFILASADRLTIDASNALLKNLEEPPAHTVFILTAEIRAHLLETIQSRSFEIRFKPLDRAGTADDSQTLDLPKIGSEAWIDYLTEHEKSNREELKQHLDEVMQNLQQQFLKDRMSDQALGAYLDAIQSLMEAKDALDSNVNQKLVLSRLTMHLVRTRCK